MEVEVCDLKTSEFPLFTYRIQAKYFIISQTLSSWDPSVLISKDPENQFDSNVCLRTDTMLKIMIDEFKKTGKYVLWVTP